MRPTLRVGAAAVGVLVGLGLASPAHASLEGGCSGALTPTSSPRSSASAPALQADTATVVEHGYVVVDVLANDTDADGDELTLLSVGSSRHGSACVDDNYLVPSSLLISSR